MSMPHVAMRNMCPNIEIFNLLKLASVTEVFLSGPVCSVEFSDSRSRICIEQRGFRVCPSTKTCNTLRQTSLYCEMIYIICLLPLPFLSPVKIHDQDNWEEVEGRFWIPWGNVQELCTAHSQTCWGLTCATPGTLPNLVLQTRFLVTNYS